MTVVLGFIDGEMKPAFAGRTFDPDRIKRRSIIECGGKHFTVQSLIVQHDNEPLKLIVQHRANGDERAVKLERVVFFQSRK